jgi:short-subunit dehydrogenase
MILNGKSVLITGAGSGIGRALAIEASRLGMRVALCGRNEASLDETSKYLENSLSDNIIIPCDITVSEHRRLLIDYIEKTWGRLDLLVNNAGIIDVGLFIDTTDEQIEKIIATNVVAPMILSKGFLPLMTKSAPARIVNIGSMFGEIPFPMFCVYSSTKSALRGFSIALRRELNGSGVSVTYAALRAVKTPATDQHDDIIRKAQPKLDIPSEIATYIWSQISKDRDTIYPQGPERLFAVLQSLLPNAVEKSVIKQMAPTNKS